MCVCGGGTETEVGDINLHNRQLVIITLSLAIHMPNTKTCIMLIIIKLTLIILSTYIQCPAVYCYLLYYLYYYYFFFYYIYYCPDFDCSYCSFGRVVWKM